MFIIELIFEATTARALSLSLSATVFGVLFLLLVALFFTPFSSCSFRLRLVCVYGCRDNRANTTNMTTKNSSENFHMECYLSLSHSLSLSIAPLLLFLFHTQAAIILIILLSLFVPHLRRLNSRAFCVSFLL